MAAKKSDKTALPTNDAWTGMLAVSLLALVAGSVLLFFDWSRHNKPPEKFKLPSPIVQQDETPPDGKEAPPGGENKGPAGDGKKGPADGKKVE